MTFREEQEILENYLLSENAKKSTNSKRINDEEKDEYRTNYQEDIRKILYSDAFRRLRTKTQVFYASGTNQHDRTRLTHTLEVTHTAKIISKALKLNTDLVEAIALGHDLGHTPYGHAGERALHNCLKEHGKTFYHNAQSVWIASTMPSEGNSVGKGKYGFNLTIDTLEGIWKHNKNIEVSKKEHKFVENLPSEMPGSLEAQVVNFSDTISYLYHDIKDSIRKGLLLEEDFIKIYWKNNFHGINFDLNLLLNTFIYDLIKNNKDNLGKEYISFSQDIDIAFKNLKKYISEHILSLDNVKESDAEAEEKITSIFTYYMYNIHELAESTEANKWKLKNYGPERVVTDYIQWFGDESADNEYDKIKKILKKRPDSGQNSLFKVINIKL